ncbi:MAG TPA: hypothetical protein VGG45_01305 [Terracidiphilus sp.]|jgi:hypothetical protein
MHRLVLMSMIVVDDGGRREVLGAEKATMKFHAFTKSFKAIAVFSCGADCLQKTFWQS